MKTKFFVDKMDSAASSLCLLLNLPRQALPTFSLQLMKTPGRCMGFYQIEVLVLTAIIHHLFSSRCYRILTDLRGRANVSREKLCKLLSL